MDSKWTFLIHPRLHLSRYSTIRIVQRICYCEVRRISQLTIPNKNWNGFDLSYEWRRKDQGTGEWATKLHAISFSKIARSTWCKTGRTFYFAGTPALDFHCEQKNSFFSMYNAAAYYTLWYCSKFFFYFFFFFFSFSFFSFFFIYYSTVSTKNGGC